MRTHIRASEKNSFLAVATISVLSLLSAFVAPAFALAATTPSLGTAATYGILSTTFTRNIGLTAITGDVGYTTLSGGGTDTVSGITSTPATPQSGLDQNAAHAVLNANACDFTFGSPTDLSLLPQPLTPGVYCITAAASIGTGGITLSGNGTYLFRIDGALTSAPGVTVSLTSGASACDVFWTPALATTLGANNFFKGTIIDDSGITVGNTTAVSGRLLASGVTVTTDTDTVAVPVCTVPATLHVAKVVIGGAAAPSSFTLHVKSGAADVAGSPAFGIATPGRVYSLSAGSYTVSEDTNASYVQTFGGDCDPSGAVTLASGDNKTCTVTNTSVGTGGGSAGTFAPLPLINVTKIPTPLALPSGPGSVTYTFAVTNIGPVAMGGVWVKDNECSPVNFISGDSNSNSLLDTGEIWLYSCTKTVSKTDTDTVTAHGQANGWDAYDTATATVVVGTSLPPPLIHLVKKPNVFVLPAGGGAVTYAYTVTNPGTTPLSDVSVTDDKCTGLPGRVTGHPGDVNKNDLLDPGETWNFTCQTNLTQTTTNIGTAEGHANGLTAIDISPATVVVAGAPAPGLPNTGLPPEGGATRDAALLDGVIAISLLFLAYVILRKRA